MELNSLELAILVDIYEMDLNSGPKINEDNYDLEDKDTTEKRQHFAALLLKLERLGLIWFDGEALTPGGRTHPKYRNRTMIIWTEHIHIREKGILLAEEAKKTVIERAKDKGVVVAGKIYNELKDLTVKTIGEIVSKVFKGE